MPFKELPMITILTRVTFLLTFISSFHPSFCTEKPPIIIDNKGDFKNFGFFYGNNFNDLQSSLKLRQRDPFGNYLNRFVINTAVPVLVIFTNGGFMEGSPVLLNPGDTCEAYDNGNGGFDFRSSNHRIGDLAILNELEQAYGFIMPENLGLAISSRLDIMYIVERINTTYLNRRKFIDDYKENHPISNEYEIAIEKIIRQKYVISLLFPVYAAQDSVGYNFDSLPAEYHAILQNNINNVFDDSQIHLNSYQLVLWNYCKYLSRFSLHASDEFESMFINAKNHFSGKSREFLMFLILKKYTGKGLPDFNKSLKTFFNDYSESDYKEYLNGLIPNTLTNDMITLSEERLSTYVGTDITWKELLNLSKGKVIYVDFWASWCKPCLQEMPYSNSLRDSLSTKSIVFLYLSIDKKRDAWIRAVGKLGSESDKHFLFQEESQLQNLFALQAIPKYLIIDKKGNIYSPDAPRPSDPRLKDVLIKLCGDIE